MADLSKPGQFLKREGGYILLEVVMAIGMVGILLAGIWTSYGSVYKSFIKERQKAQDLEEVRLVINFIEDTFQRYEGGKCQVLLRDTGSVRGIYFEDENGVNPKTILYSQYDRKISFQNQEISSRITNFTGSPRGELYDFIVESESIKVRTSVNLKYRKGFD